MHARARAVLLRRAGCSGTPGRAPCHPAGPAGPGTDTEVTAMETVNLPRVRVHVPLLPEVLCRKRSRMRIGTLLAELDDSPELGPRWEQISVSIKEEGT